MELPNLVSRKKDFIPQLTATVTGGFVPSQLALKKTAEQLAVNSVDEYGVVSKEYSAEQCCAVLTRRPSVVPAGTQRRASAFAGMAVPGGGWANITTSPTVQQREVTDDSARTKSSSPRVEEEEEEEEDVEKKDDLPLAFPGSHRKMVKALQKISKLYDEDTSEYMKDVATPLLTALTSALLKNKPPKGDIEKFVAEYVQGGSWKSA